MNIFKVNTRLMNDAITSKKKEAKFLKGLKKKKKSKKPGYLPPEEEDLQDYYSGEHK